MIRHGEFDPERRTGKREKEKQHVGHVVVADAVGRYSIADASDAAFLVAATKVVYQLKRESGNGSE